MVIILLLARRQPQFETACMLVRQAMNIMTDCLASIE
jgi:hypothetical protein